MFKVRSKIITRLTTIKALCLCPPSAEEEWLEEQVFILNETSGEPRSVNDPIFCRDCFSKCSPLFRQLQHHSPLHSTAPFRLLRRLLVFSGICLIQQCNLVFTRCCSRRM
uniref:C2H2-type domain-containing protein n=1 Tax=Ascaris lumbricoides TaxID=6252 RepID=A0A0M3HU20_ASCLU